MMRTLKRYLTIGTLALGLSAVSAKSYAGPVCVIADYPTVLEIGQAGEPGSPLVIGGYLVAYGEGWQKVPIVGSLTLNTDGTVKIGYTSHFDWGSGNWLCPVGDTVITTSLDSAPVSDTTYHGGEPDDVDADCPNNFIEDVELISCEGLSPFDPELLPTAISAAGKNSR